MTDAKGKWAHHCWDEIAAYSEKELFWMAFPEEFIKTEIIPTMNDHLASKHTWGEFYKWLGCNFFMACFQGIADRELWWSKESVSMFEAKQWVDDVNNCWHDPIGLEEVWGTKWWVMHQFTFLCSVAEVNAVQSWA